ncbi:MAG: replication factor C large subunit [Candidatus Pacearchaeota archaeon]
MIIWAEKYRPKNIKEIENLKEKETVLDFVKNYEERKKKYKACLIYGPPGTGKTALAYAIANQLQLELIEMNASDFRDKRNIKKIIGSAIEQKSLFKKKKIIVIDELEGITGKEDAGGLGELLNLIEYSQYPIILITNDPFDKRFTELRKKCLLIETKKLRVNDIIKILKRIAKNEKLEIGDDALKLIATYAKGDARAAINDLQTLSQKRKKILLGEVTEYLKLATRDREQKIFDALRILFNSKILHTNIFENVEMEIDEIIRWVEENIPKEYTNLEELAKAYEMLALADLYLARITTWQYWRFIVYANIFLCAIGPYAGKKEFKWIGYNYPSFFIEMYRKKISKEKEIISKLSKKLHCSTRKIKNEMPIMRKFLKLDLD